MQVGNPRTGAGVCHLSLEVHGHMAAPAPCSRGQRGLSRGRQRGSTPQGEGGVTGGRDWSGGGAQGGGETAEAKGGFFRGPPGSSALLSSFASRPSSVWHPRGGSGSKRPDWGALHPRVCQGKGCAKGRTRCGAHGDIQESGIEAADQQARLGGQRPRQQGARGEVTAQRRDRSPGQRAGPWETRPGGRSARVLRRARGAEPAPRARSAAPPPPGEQGGPGRLRPSRMDVTA